MKPNHNQVNLENPRIRLFAICGILMVFAGFLRFFAGFLRVILLEHIHHITG